MLTQDDVLRFYDQNYDFLGNWFLKPGEKHMLGDKSNRVCRFCGRGKPEVQFRKEAHAISEMLGNKSLFTASECDTCNGCFGRTIEQDFGNWSKPIRTMSRIRGKNGVPKLKRGGDTGWRIEYSDERGLQIKDYEADPVQTLDGAARSARFRLKRDPYTPVGVLKAFVKMGLTLLPDGEMPNFRNALAWIKDKDLSRPFANSCPVFYSFQPGPMPNDKIAAFVLRRKAGVEDLPYAFFILGYGNEVFQVTLPSEKDKSINGKTISIPPFPTPGSSDPKRFPMTGRGVLDLTGREVVRGEAFEMTMGFDDIVWMDENGAPTSPPA